MSTGSKRSQPKPPQPSGPATEAALKGQVKIKVVAGLDTASNRLHLVCSNGYSFGYTCPKKMQEDDRRHQLYDRAENMFGLLPRGTLVVVEEPLALQNGKTTRLLGLAAGAIWAAHLKCPVFWAWADVAAWKKAVIGNGNADKAAIARWVQDNMGLEFDEEDSYDAAAIMRYGQQAVGLA